MLTSWLSTGDYTILFYGPEMCVLVSYRIVSRHLTSMGPDSQVPKQIPSVSIPEPSISKPLEGFGQFSRTVITET